MTARSCFLLAALLAAGCGQKGPLFLPDRDATDVVIRPAPSAPPATPTGNAPGEGPVATEPGATPVPAPVATPEPAREPATEQRRKSEGETGEAPPPPDRP